jgi:hypothetical protein
MSKKTVLTVLAVVAALGYGASVSAELLASPTSKAEAEAFELGAAFISSEITLENDGDDSDIERQMISVYGAYGVNDMVDVYAGVAMILKAEADDINADGDGFGWGGGIRGDLPIGDEVTLRGYTQFLYISEEYDPDGLDGEGWFVDVGVLAMYEASDDVNIYGGLELAPFDNFEVKVSGDYLNHQTIDFERDDLLTIRLGAKFDIEDLFLRGELAFAGEKSFTIGAGMTF